MHLFSAALLCVVVAGGCVGGTAAISATEMMLSCLEFVQSVGGTFRGGGGGSRSGDNDDDDDDGGRGGGRSGHSFSGPSLHIVNSSICLNVDGTNLFGTAATDDSDGGVVATDSSGSGAAFASSRGRDGRRTSSSSSSGGGRRPPRDPEPAAPTDDESTSAVDVAGLRRKFPDELDTIGMSTTAWRYDNTPRNAHEPDNPLTRLFTGRSGDFPTVAPSAPAPASAPPAPAPAPAMPAAPPAAPPAAAPAADDDYGDGETVAPAPAPAPAAAPAAAPAPAPAPAAPAADDDYGDGEAPAPAAPAAPAAPSAPAPPAAPSAPAAAKPLPAPGAPAGFVPDRVFTPLCDDAHLSPFSSTFKSLIGALVKVLTNNYIVLGKDFFKWYKPRMASNAELIKGKIGVAGDLQSVMPVLLRHENAIWKHTTDYLATIEAYVEPLLDMIEKRVASRLTAAQLRDRTVRDAIDLYHAVIPDAEYDYQDNLDVCRNRYKHDLDDQIDGLLRLQERARDFPEENRSGELQREYEAWFDAKQKLLIKTMAEYWNKVKAIYFHYLANIEQSSNYLLSVVQ